MSFNIYNTFSRKIEKFQSQKPNEVTIYSCGPTVYSYAHIGNFRTFVFNDLLRRYLRFKGFRVNHVMNITDIDDKTINGAAEENVSLFEFTKKYINIFFQDIKYLNLETVEHYPRATDYVPSMIQFIEKLLEKGYAYESDGSVYFKISAFSGYGQLAKIDPEQVKTGLRYDTDEYEKEDIRDFVLWKKAGENEIAWEASFAKTGSLKGRPGWHIECSVMAKEIIKATLDIHTGGVDLIFPHHENEIAQSESLSGKKFVNYWIHVEHLLVDNQKMSKSTGNLLTLKDLAEKGYEGREIRYILLSSHYRKKFNFTFAGLKSAQNSLKRIDSLIRRLKEIKDSYPHKRLFLEKEQNIFLEKFEQALDNDLNISEALSHLFLWIHKLNEAVESFAKESNELYGKEEEEEEQNLTANEIINIFIKIDAVLGFIFKKDIKDIIEENLLGNSSTSTAAVGIDIEKRHIDSDKNSQSDENMTTKQIQTLLQDRETARLAKDFAKADKIRRALLANGISIEDTPGGTRWYR